MLLEYILAQTTSYPMCVANPVVAQHNTHRERGEIIEWCAALSTSFPIIYTNGVDRLGSANNQDN